MSYATYTEFFRRINQLPERQYIYVPFTYKEMAKELGAKFDFDKKKWYAEKTNREYQKLVDLFNADNFYEKKGKWYMKLDTSTEAERKRNYEEIS